MSSGKTFGKHYLVDFFDCDPERIKFVAPVRTAFLDAAVKSGATIVGDCFHQFEPEGVSGVVLIAESHFSLHSWPEDGYVAVDVFTCGEEMDAELAIAELQRHLGAGRREVCLLTRGQLAAQRGSAVGA